MNDATFGRPRPAVGPLALVLPPGRWAALTFETPRQARLASLLAAGIVKASSGAVLVGQYDPRVQPAHCKRLAAFVPHLPLALDPADFARYVAYRAALWQIDAGTATRRAHAALQALDGVHEALAYPLAAALIGDPKLVVLDRPPAAYGAQFRTAIGQRAAFSTHVDAATAAIYAELVPA